MGKSRGLPVARPAAEPWHPRSSTFVGSSSPGTPVLVRDSAAGLVERLEAGEDARAPVIGATVEDEPLIGAERYFVNALPRADNDDAGNPIRGDTREHTARGRCADMPGAAEEQLGWATASSRTLLDECVKDEQADARAGRAGRGKRCRMRLLEDVDTPGPLRPLQGGDSAAVVRESVAGDALEGSQATDRSLPALVRTRMESWTWLHRTLQPRALRRRWLQEELGRSRTLLSREGRARWNVPDHTRPPPMPIGFPRREGAAAGTAHRSSSGGRWKWLVLVLGESPLQDAAREHAHEAMLIVHHRDALGILGLEKPERLLEWNVRPDREVRRSAIERSSVEVGSSPRATTSRTSVFRVTTPTRRSSSVT